MNDDHDDDTAAGMELIAYLMVYLTGLVATLVVMAHFY